MSPEQFFVTGLTVLLLVVLASGKVSYDAIGLGLMVVLVASGVIDTEAALGGFSNYAVITIGALYIVGEGLTRTGAVEFIAHWVLKFGRNSEFALIMSVGLVTAAFSAFLNNTAVVLVFIPVLVGVAKETGIPSSRLLIPMAYASLFGGMCTLVGTSTNLLVNGVAVQEGEAPLTMFELSPVGVPLTLIGLLVMAIISRLLLPARQSISSTTLSDEAAREYVTEIVIGPESPLLGKTVGEFFSPTKLRLRYLLRNERMLQGPFDEIELKKWDVLMLAGKIADLSDMQQRLGLKLVGNLKFDPKSMTFFELAVAPTSTMVGRRICDLHLWRDYRSVAIAVLRHGHHIKERVAELILRPGDLLLVCGEAETSLPKIRASTDFYLLTGAHKHIVLRGHARRAIGIALGVVALFTAYSSFGLKYIPLPMAAILGAMGMIVSGCVTPRRAYRVIDWPILIFVAGTLALGEAMKATETAAYFANAMVNSMKDYGPVAVVGGLVFLATLFNAFVSHSAVAVLLTPIAIQVAHVMPGDYAVRPFLLAIALGGSVAFATPQGHQVNLMVLGPGGYKYMDFLRLGIPISIVAWALITIGIALQEGWNLWPG